MDRGRCRVRRMRDHGGTLTFAPPAARAPYPPDVPALLPAALHRGRDQSPPCRLQTVVRRTAHDQPPRPVNHPSRQVRRCAPSRQLPSVSHPASQPAARPPGGSGGPDCRVARVPCSAVLHWLQRSAHPAGFSACPPKPLRMADSTWLVKWSRSREPNLENSAVARVGPARPPPLRRPRSSGPRRSPRRGRRIPARTGDCSEAAAVRSSSHDVITLPRRQTSATSARSMS